MKRLLHFVVGFSFLVTSLSASAFKIEGHVWLADEIRRDIVKGKGHVTINGQSYPLNAGIRSAIQVHRGAFLMGVMGADIYPDMLAGQMTMHPGVAETIGTTVAWQTDDWLQFVLDEALYSERSSPQAVAFAAGYVLHAAMDMWAHTWVNGYVGDSFAIIENGATAERHIALEAYLKTFHHTLISDDQNTQNNHDAYSNLFVPARFVSQTLILNPTVATQYRQQLSTAYLAAIWDYYQTVRGFRSTSQNVINALTAEFDRIDPILTQIKIRKAAVDDARKVFEGHLTRLKNGAQQTIDWGVSVVEGSGLLGAVENVIGDIDLDSRAISAKGVLEAVHGNYVSEVHKLNYGIDELLDPDALRTQFANALQSVSADVVDSWVANIEDAMTQYIVAWELTAKELMRPHGDRFSLNNDPLTPMMNWAKCWAPVLSTPVPQRRRGGTDLAHVCTRTLEGYADWNDQITLLKGHIGDQIPFVPALKNAITQFDEKSATFANVQSKNITNALADVVPPGLPVDFVALAKAMLTTWDKHPSAAGLNQSYTASTSHLELLEKPISTSVHKDLGVCEKQAVAANYKAATYKDKPIADFAPMQNAVTMSKLALLDAAQLNRMMSNVSSSRTNAQANLSPARASRPGTSARGEVQSQYRSKYPMGVVLLGALRSIDGNHQWLAESPLLPRERPSEDDNKCRRFGYPASGEGYAECGRVGDQPDPYDGAIFKPLLAQKTGFLIAQGARKTTVFDKLFQPVDTNLCELLEYYNLNAEMCDANASLASAEPGENGPAKDTRVQTNVRTTTPRQQASNTGRKTAVSPAQRVTQARTPVQQRAKQAQRTTAPRRTSLRTRSAGFPTASAFDKFASQATQHNWYNAYLLSLLSYATYPGAIYAGRVDEKALEAQFARWGLTYIDWVDITTHGVGSGSTQFVAAKNSDTLFIVFRGSTITPQDLGQDWLDNDLDFTPTFNEKWGPGVTLHDGFYDAAKLAFDEVADIVRTHGAQRKVWISGHSLGGALAVLNAFELTQRSIEVNGVYIYGAPPVGNAAWRAAYEQKVSNTHRWSAQNDPVTSVMVQLPGPFEHVGRRHNLLANGQVDLNHHQEFVYPMKAITRTLGNDLANTHMSYWCRLRQLAITSGGMIDPPWPPNSACYGCAY